MSWTETPLDWNPGQRPLDRDPPGQRPPWKETPWDKDPLRQRLRPPLWTDRHLRKHNLRRLRLRAVKTPHSKTPTWKHSCVNTQWPKNAADGAWNRKLGVRQKHDGRLGENLQTKHYHQVKMRNLRWRFISLTTRYRLLFNLSTSFANGNVDVVEIITKWEGVRFW